MKLLKEFSRTVIEAEKDMSATPPDKISEIQKNIRTGAADLEQNWANALELVQRAYKVANVERPSPGMKDAWTQYEENIQYAVKQLSKIRGMDADWRMSAAMFHEAEEKLMDFKVTISGSGEDLTHTVKGSSIENIIGTLSGGVGPQYDVEVVDELPRGRKYRVINKGPVKSKTNNYITIERV